jgi:S-adenosylmethionine:tRNA ribosyltransferase-isomerase
MSTTRRDFSYDLPAHLIAQTPLPNRTDSRLMVVDPGRRELLHRHFSDLPDLLSPLDLLVLNDTRVIRARLYARKDSGGQAELLIERIEPNNQAWCQVRASKPLLAGRVVHLQPTGEPVRVAKRCDDLFLLEFARSVDSVLADCGRVPLPPYITRAPDVSDEARYQTVYAEHPGSVAAPTAGLHFDATLLERCVAAGVSVVRITLHVGAGTFQPVRAAELDQHRMHSERVHIGADVVAAIDACRQRGGRVVAVGTTVVRALESAGRDGHLDAFDGETDIFIRPGYAFRIVDALVTNFHLPESTLLMLVSAFAGRTCVLNAYAEAVRKRYRFFSYGDAMFLTARASADAL